MKAYKRYISLFLFGIVISCQSLQDLEAQKHTGRALGTTYSIQYQGSATDYENNQKAFDSIFQMLNHSMSTYWPQSIITRINEGMDTVTVDNHFKKVFHKATEIWTATSGLFDPTVGSLVNAYGFGPVKGLKTLNNQQIDSLLELTGWHKIQLTKKGKIHKLNPRIRLDFNAIAKGYTVDVIANFLTSKGCQNFLVEIGGEIVARGISPKSQKPWTIAIDDPQQQKQRTFQTTVALNNAALATSGNYRKFRIDSLTGKKYVHTLNPKTGRPVRSNILSTSVRASDCMTADAWATALMVLPLKTGQLLVEKNPDIEAFWIVAHNKETVEVRSSRW